MIDFLGHKLSKDDFVVYPVRHGSNIWMTSGTITHVGKGYIEIEKIMDDFSKRKYKIKNIHNVVKVTDHD